MQAVRGEFRHRYVVPNFSRFGAFIQELLQEVLQALLRSLTDELTIESGGAGSTISFSKRLTPPE